MENIEKGGEGSKGGQVVGHTRSGKPIYRQMADQYKDFDEKDHKDAADFHHLDANKRSKQGTAFSSRSREYRNSHVTKFQKSEDNMIGINNYNNQSINPYLVKSFDTIPTESDVRASLKDKLEKAIINQDTYDKAIVQLDNLIKAGKGEGSKGGHVIGHTKSGKPVYAHGTSNHAAKDFTSQDHKDAAQLHNEKANKHKNAAFDSQYKGDDNGYHTNGALHEHHKLNAHQHNKLAESIDKKSAHDALSNDEKKIIADQKKKQISHHEMMSSLHSTTRDHIIKKFQEKYAKGEGRPKEVDELIHHHNSQADHHQSEKERLEKE